MQACLSRQSPVENEGMGEGFTHSEESRLTGSLQYTRNCQSQLWRRYRGFNVIGV
jgi:hypothetical protein